MYFAVFGDINGWFLGRWNCLTTGMLYGARSPPFQCPSFSEIINTLGNQHRFTATSASSSEMWGTSVAAAFICYSPQAVHWVRVNWVSTFPSPLNRWMLGTLYSVNLGYLVAFVRALSRKPGLVSAPQFARLRKTHPTFTSIAFLNSTLDSWNPAPASRLNSPKNGGRP